MESMPSRLKRYQTEGHHHFLTFSCHRRLSYLVEPVISVMLL